MVKKKDGSNRVCIDFRKLNKITEVDPEPMTTAEDFFRKLSGKKYLSKIDLTKGYWQIPVAPEDVHKTAFMTPDRQYEFTRMPFGMVKKVLRWLEDLGRSYKECPDSEVILTILSYIATADNNVYLTVLCDY